MARERSRRRRAARKSLRMIWGLLLIFALGGCTAILGQPEDPDATPTPNPTLEAIAVMLTETRAAPSTTPVTPTVTPSITPTLTITPTRQVIGRVGEAVEAGGLTLALLSTTRQAALENRKAGEGQEFVSMEVLLANQSERAVEYYPLYFRLRAAGGSAGTGAEYEPLNTAAWPALQGGVLRPGERVRGHLAFLIPQEARGLRLRFINPEQASLPPMWVDLAQPTAAPRTLVPATGGWPGGLPGEGRRVEESGVALTIQQVSAGQRINGVRAAKGRIYANLDVSIQNTTREQMPYNPFYFKARDADGYEYAPLLLGIESLLHPGSLGMGQQVSGRVVFEVPEGTRRLLISYQPQVLVEDYGEIRMEVEIPIVD